MSLKIKLLTSYVINLKNQSQNLMLHNVTLKKLTPVVSQVYAKHRQ